MAGLVPWGRFSIPVTFTRIPKMTRDPAIDQVNHCDAIHHNGLPRTKIEATRIAIAHGMTVMNIQSMCNTERRKEMKVCIRLTARNDKVCKCAEVGVHDGIGWISCRQYAIGVLGSFARKNRVWLASHCDRSDQVAR